MEFLFKVENVSDAYTALCASVKRVFFDIEWMGKTERQKKMGRVFKEKSLQPLKEITKVIGNQADITVRLNPFYKATVDEVEFCLKNRVSTIMLPMFKRISEVKEFIKIIGGRARVSLLLETRAALENAGALIELKGIDEIHVGFNDLSLDLGFRFLFDVLKSGIMDVLAVVFKAAEIKFGFGGVAKIGKGLIPAQYILLEHERLGSTQAFLSKEFYELESSIEPAYKVYKEEIEKLRFYYKKAKLRTKVSREKDKYFVKGLIEGLHLKIA